MVGRAPIDTKYPRLAVELHLTGQTPTRPFLSDLMPFSKIYLFYIYYIILLVLGLPDFWVRRLDDC